MYVCMYVNNYYIICLSHRDHYEKLWLPEFSHLKTTLQQALAEKTNLDALVLL